METLPHIPQQIYAGDTLSFNRLLPDYSAADGWTLEYIMGGPASVEFSTTADGSAHSANVSATVTSDWAPGTYSIAEKAVKGDERYTTGVGTIEVLADPSSATTDARPHCKRMLDAIEATLEGTASNNQRSYTHNNRSIERYDILDLIKIRNQYAAQWRAYQRKQAGKTSRLIKARFT